MVNQGQTVFDSVFSVYAVVALVVWAIMMLRYGLGGKQEDLLKG